MDEPLPLPTLPSSVPQHDGLPAHEREHPSLKVKLHPLRYTCFSQTQTMAIPQGLHEADKRGGYSGLEAGSGVLHQGIPGHQTT